jgi:sugar (pentulose or hexulose) kinase
MRGRTGAVAVDLGASSCRFARGDIRYGVLSYEIVERIQHAPAEVDGRLTWDIERLIDFCRRAVQYAESEFKQATVGIDTWGVDFGLIDKDGALVAPVVAYRDQSHVDQSEALAQHRSRLYQHTGCQHQPFNTLYQLAARRKEDPYLPERSTFLLLPDLLGCFLSGVRGYELTHASTTQLMGLDGGWCEEAFDLIGWPVPESPPDRPGRDVGRCGQAVQLVKVAGHDTASAVCGLGTLEGACYLNIGTWSLLGVLRDEPLATPETEAGNWTNERAHDGRVRFQKNIPGMYVINRLHEELKLGGSVAEWIESLPERQTETFDYMAPELFNPPCMREACARLLGCEPRCAEEWGLVAFNSMVEATGRQPAELASLTGEKFSTLRISGGASASQRLCQALADASGLTVLSGPQEATLLGNLGMQFVASGEVALSSLAKLIDNSVRLVRYEPRGNCAKS